MSFLKVSQVAKSLTVSRFAIYDWIEKGLIPENAILRIGYSIRLDAERIEEMAREGKLRRQRKGRSDGREAGTSKIPENVYLIRKFSAKGHPGHGDTNGHISKRSKSRKRAVIHHSLTALNKLTEVALLNVAKR